MQKKDFLYFLTDKNGLCYKVVAGEIILDNTVVPLYYTPDGWQDQLIQWARNNTYFGLVRSFTTPLRFVVDGGQIIRKKYYEDGIQAECYLRIAKLNRSTGHHEKWFVGALDFSTINDENQYVEISVLDNGLESEIKAKEGTTYEIPIGPDTESEVPFGTDPSVKVFLDGIELRGGLAYINLNRYQWDRQNWFYLNIIFLQEEGEVFDIEHRDITDLQTSRASNYNGDPNFKVITSKKDGVEIGASLKYRIGILGDSMDHQYNPNKTSYQIVAISSGGSTVTALTDKMYREQGDVTDEEVIFEGDITSPVSLNLDKDDYINVFFVAKNEDSSTADIWYAIKYYEFTLKFITKTRHAPTYTKALKPSFIFDRIIDNIAGSLGNARSDLLDDFENNKPYTVLMTTGDAIRQLDSRMKVKFKDFFNSINCLFNAGFSVEDDKARIERKDSYFQDETELTNVGNVTELRVSPAKDYFFNLIKVGYAEQNYDQVNGKDAFNQTSEFSTPITRVQKTLDLVNPYRADMYGIEFTRINTQGKDTTDKKADDEIFLLVVENKIYTNDQGEEYYKLSRDDFGPLSAKLGIDHIDGLISPDTAFNFQISPKNILMRHADYIRSGLVNLDGEKIKFQSASKNDKLAVYLKSFVSPIPPYQTITPNPVIEKEDMVIGYYMDDPLFYPYIFEFKTAIPNGVKDIFDSDPKGFITFGWKGEEYRGFIMECGIQPAFREAQEWKLLATKDNDMKKLIKYAD